MRCDIAFYKLSLIPGVVVLLTTTYLFILCLGYGFLEPGVSLEAASLSPGIEVRLAYILPSPDPINSFAIGGIILGMVVVVVTLCISISHNVQVFKIPLLNTEDENTPALTEQNRWN
ncbi:hypothetical protein Hanom_Chr08g00750091 [Helianthus anomalus]